MTPLPTLTIGGDGAAASPSASGERHAAPWAGAPEAARRAAAVAAAHAEADDEKGGFPARGLDALRKEGLLAAPLAPERGGLGLGTDPRTMHALYLALAEVGRGSLPLGRIWEGHVNALALVEAYGTPEQKERWGADARAGHLFGVWNTEIPREGVRYEREGASGVRVHGAKTFTTGGAYVTRPLVPGAMGGARQMAILATDRLPVVSQPGWWRAEGMRASRSGRTDFSDALAPADSLLGEPDAYMCEPHFSGGAVRFAAVQLGGAEALAEAAAAHLAKLGRTDHPVHQIRLGEMATAVETGRLWLLGAARLWARYAESQEAAAREDALREDAPPEASGDGASPDTPAPDAPEAVPAEAVCHYARMARSAIERVCLDVLERADRAVGARGLGQPGVLERTGRDLRLYLRQPDPDGALADAGALAAQTPRPARGADL